MNDGPSDYRCERKYLTDALDPFQVISLVKQHPSAFIVPFPPRYINNIYLDTKNMTYYHENVIGSKNRRKARILTQVPAGRMGEASEIGAAVLYLASPEAGYVTGAVLHVNGGMAMI